MRILNMDLPDTPQARFWTWVVAIIVGTAGVLLFLDVTFARKADAMSRSEVEALVTAATTAQAATINLATEYAIDQQSKRSIETKLFELEQIPPAQLRPQDRALYAKLQRDRDDLVRLWLQRGRPLR